MFNLRIAVASTVTFVVLMIVWTNFVDKGYDKIRPKLEEQQQRALDQQREFSKIIREDMAELGATPMGRMANMNQLMSEEIPDQRMPARSRKPLGTWMGVRQGDRDMLAFAKFNKEDYWLWIKNPGGEDLKEKGEYDFEFDSIHFRPKGKSSYYMDYYMISRDGIQLSGYNYNYSFEKDESIKFDF